MEAWTNGTYHVALAVDVDADLLWTGWPVTEYRLSDLSRLQEVGDRVAKVAALGGGRVAALFVNPDGDPATLRLGRPGEWEKEVRLGPYTEGRRGISRVDDALARHFVGRDAYLSANEHGIAVADGNNGAVIRLDLDGNPQTPWSSGGAPEAELIAYPTAAGVVVTARWAARAARACHVFDDEVVPLGAPYGGKAIPAGQLVFLPGNRGLDVVHLDGQPAAVGTGSIQGFVEAHAASDRTAVLVGDGFMHVFDLTGQSLSGRTLSTALRFRIEARFHRPPGQPRAQHRNAIYAVTSKHRAQGSLSTKKKHYLLVVDGLERERADELANGLGGESSCLSVKVLPA